MVVAVEIDGQSSTINLRPFAVVLQGMVRKQILSQCCICNGEWVVLLDLTIAYFHNQIQKITKSTEISCVG